MSTCCRIYSHTFVLHYQVFKGGLLFFCDCRMLTLKPCLLLSLLLLLLLLLFVLFCFLGGREIDELNMSCPNSWRFQYVCDNGIKRGFSACGLPQFIKFNLGGRRPHLFRVELFYHPLNSVNVNDPWTVKTKACPTMRETCPGVLTDQTLVISDTNLSLGLECCGIE